MTVNTASNGWWQESDSPQVKRDKIALGFGRGFRYFTNMPNIDVPYQLAFLKNSDSLADAKPYSVAWDEDNNVLEGQSSIFVIDNNNICSNL